MNVLHHLKPNDKLFRFLLNVLIRKHDLIANMVIVDNVPLSSMGKSFNYLRHPNVEKKNERKYIFYDS